MRFTFTIFGRFKSKLLIEHIRTMPDSTFQTGIEVCREEKRTYSVEM